MEKAVMISIKPKWCEKIFNEDKTVEIRKTFPHNHMPFKCYIYCTKDKNNQMFKSSSIYYSDKLKLCKIDENVNGMVIGEFVCDRYSIEYLSSFPMKEACMDWSDAENYFGLYSNREVYAWHISNLKFYTNPKELSEFGVKRAPQSWMYVEDLNERK